ncbi:UNVERIFIED_ORG: hypothetical protein ABIC97_004955 [Peribacillus simplex]
MNNRLHKTLLFMQPSGALEQKETGELFGAIALSNLTMEK